MDSTLKRRLLLAAGLLGLCLFLGWERQELLRAALAAGAPLAAARRGWFFLALLCLSIFGIAWQFRPDLTALAAPIIFAGAPAAQKLLFANPSGLAVVAWVAAAYWALIASDGFQFWPGALAFGLICALGSAGQWCFFSYLLPALWAAGKALRDPKNRVKALAALAVVLAGFTPRWPAHTLFLLTGFIQIPAGPSSALGWSGGFFSYFRDSINVLGLPFFLLGWLSLLSPRHKRRLGAAWLLPAWLAFSYLFWIFIPGGRMSLFLPGLPALAVSAASAWPETLVWLLAGFQLAGAANFPAGIIPPFSVATPFGQTATLLPSRQTVKKQ